MSGRRCEYLLRVVQKVKLRRAIVPLREPG
jgi:hypothetical protein